MGNKKPVIELKEVELGYRGKPVVRRLNCVIERGDSLGIVGPNGSGKTTLLKAILGLIPPLSGEIHTDMSLRFAYVPQTEMLSLRLPLTVRDVVYLALKSRRSLGWITADERQAAERAMERVALRLSGTKPCGIAPAARDRGPFWPRRSRKSLMSSCWTNPPKGSMSLQNMLSSPSWKN